MNPSSSCMTEVVLIRLDGPLRPFETGACMDESSIIHASMEYRLIIPGGGKRKVFGNTRQRPFFSVNACTFLVEGRRPGA